MRSTFLIDSHVHIYAHYNVATFFDIAYLRMAQAAKDKSTQFVLLLTETAQDDAFQRLSDGSLDPSPWRVTAFQQDPSALRIHHEGREILVVAGRQIVTEERIEVLALATTDRFQDGAPIDEVLSQLRAASIPAVLPWGVGKWFGKRGARVSTILASLGADKGLMLGDNAGRPIGWPAPKVFQSAASLGISVLPGSDPLPVIGAEQDVGGYAFLLSGDVDPNTPGLGLKTMLFQSKGQPTFVGRRKGLIAVLLDQWKLRRNRQN